MPPNTTSGQITNVFSVAEILSIQKALSTLPQAVNSGPVSKAYTNGFKHTDYIYYLIKKMVLNKIEPHLGVLKLTVGMYLKEFAPWPIHTDYAKNDQNPGLAVLIPLHTDHINTHTVIFNEECVDSFSRYMDQHPKLENNATHLHSTLMSHVPKDHLEYVSLQNAAFWHPGSVIFWNRNLLHSSDNFIAAGVAEKHALVMFFNND